MIINKRVVFRPTYNSDSTEGRGRTLDVDFCFEYEKDAIKFVESDYYKRNYGVWNTKGSKFDIKEIEVKDGHPITIKIYDAYGDFVEDFKQVINLK